MLQTMPALFAVIGESYQEALEARRAGKPLAWSMIIMQFLKLSVPAALSFCLTSTELPKFAAVENATTKNIT